MASGSIVGEKYWQNINRIWIYLVQTWTVAMPQHFAEAKKLPIRAGRKEKQQIHYTFLIDKDYHWLYQIQ